MIPQNIFDKEENNFFRIFGEWLERKKKEFSLSNYILEQNTNLEKKNYFTESGSKYLHQISGLFGE